MQAGIECYPLTQKMRHLSRIAKWHYAQWGYLRPKETLDDVRNLYLKRLQFNQLPITYILFKRHTPVGMFSLLPNTYPFFVDKTLPVLNHLLIAKPYRGQNLFKPMMRFVDQAAVRMGFSAICGFTIDKRLNHLYESLGCHRIGESVFLSRKIFLFRKWVVDYPQLTGRMPDEAMV